MNKSQSSRQFNFKTDVSDWLTFTLTIVTIQPRFYTTGPWMIRPSSPLPPPHSMLFFQYIHYRKRKPNASNMYNPTLNRGRRGKMFEKMLCIWAICPETFETAEEASFSLLLHIGAALITNDVIIDCGHRNIGSNYSNIVIFLWLQSMTLCQRAMNERLSNISLSKRSFGHLLSIPI
jgi:hypothetical protein